MMGGGTSNELSDVSFCRLLETRRGRLCFLPVGLTRLFTDLSSLTFDLKNDINGCRLQALRGSARHGTMAGLCSVARGGGLGFGACERDCVRLRPPVLRARQHPLSSERLQNHHKILQHSSIGHGEVAVTRFPALQHRCGVRKPTFAQPEARWPAPRIF